VKTGDYHMERFKPMEPAKRDQNPYFRDEKASGLI
jgi:hypothetical protein